MAEELTGAWMVLFCLYDSIQKPKLKQYNTLKKKKLVKGKQYYLRVRPELQQDSLIANIVMILYTLH